MFHHVSDILGLKNQKSDNFMWDAYYSPVPNFKGAYKKGSHNYHLSKWEGGHNKNRHSLTPFV